MSSARNQYPPTFPVVPPSLSAGDHGMRDNYSAEDTQRPTPHTVPNITPYLGLRARLSQVWINRWTILLLLILVRVLIGTAGLNHDLASAKNEAMSACTAVESMGSTMASMPHYLSAGVNELAGAGVEKAVHGLMSMLRMTITGVEELMVFYINMLTGTYLCLITLVVSGSLQAAIALIEEVSKFLDDNLKPIGDDIAKGVGNFQNDFNKFLGGLNSVPKLFGGDGIPKIDLNSSVDKLHNFKLPTNFTADLEKLNSSIPDFQTVQKDLDNVIRLPFDTVKNLVDGKLQFTFNRSLLPVPQKEKLTFCSENNGITNFFDDIAKIIIIARKVFLVVLLLGAILACVPMAIQEIRRWRTMQDRAKLITDKSFDPLDAVYIASRPYTATAGIKVAAPFSSTKKQVLTRWVIAYATSVPALVVLSLAITGLLSCLCQYILLKLVVKEVPALAADIGQFADVVVNKLDAASEAWANGTNSAILGVQGDINHDVFGWVNTTTVAVNNTLNEFVDKTTKLLNDAFGGTVLNDPVHKLFDCLIGLKIDAIEKGLTWVSDNAQVKFPLLNNNTFSLGAAASIAGSNSSGSASSFLANPGSDAQDQVTNAVVKVARHFADGIRTEAIISTCVLLLWVIILLSGVARALYLALRAEKIRAEGGPSYAGDIPLEDRGRNTVYSTSGPAPAYEPPQQNPNAFPSFGQAMGRGARTSHVSEQDEYPDEKVGFGGLRDLTHEHAAMRQSSYPTIEKA
ncbi:hypothetical protein N7G274_000888 [Stereocaulon virgatum]|uniref:Plasma membrane fusion protein PRM1 n=1 Tax=Stereocaulon virgatum TaxID=373712 RepID=A0ABR4AN31_9LECA